MTETWISECLDMTDVERQWTEESLTALIDILRTSCSISLRQPDLMSRKHPLSIAFENILQLCTYALTRGTQGSPPSSPSTETKDVSVLQSLVTDAQTDPLTGLRSIPLTQDLIDRSWGNYPAAFYPSAVAGDGLTVKDEKSSKPSSETVGFT